MTNVFVKIRIGTNLYTFLIMSDSTSSKADWIVIIYVEGSEISAKFPDTCITYR